MDFDEGSSGEGLGVLAGIGLEIRKNVKVNWRRPGEGYARRIRRLETRTPLASEWVRNVTLSQDVCWASRDGSAGSCHFRGGYADKV